MRVLVAGLEVLVSAGHTVGVGGVSVQAKAKAAGDGKIPGGGRAQPPPRDVHVSRASRSGSGVLLTERATILVSGTQQRPLRKQAWFLKLGPKIGGFGGMKNHVAEKVVPARTVASSAADQRVVPKPVQHGITERAFDISLRETNPQPASEHSNEQRRLDGKPSRFAGGGVPMRTGPLAEQVKVIAARLASIVLELRHSALLDALRKHLLGQLLRHGRRPVIVVDTPVILPEGHTLGSKVGTSGGSEQVVGV